MEFLIGMVVGAMLTVWAGVFVIVTTDLYIRRFKEDE